MEALSYPEGVCFVYSQSSFAVYNQTREIEQRHAKWVEFMKNFTFFIKNISGSANKVADDFEQEMFDLAGIPSGYLGI
jgi:hypothetical protein